ncbi:hypothetical protein [uncultured Serinicoccus sp.]|uniref:hypothetical protein n=1 Tax=uncultured Serinicoccus sp. TaxID=735514 RepID=UPI00262D0430|nr:hypothetical protein [uncultured Serinicoccus sp.]
MASAAFIHVATYLLVGLIASRALDYTDLLGRPVISDYYLPYGSADLLASTALQVLRGALFGLVLLPFCGVLADSRWGWLWVWSVFVVIGILGTPAAAPSSFEGVVYTRLPWWFHLVGLPEMVVQTLGFSVWLHRTLRAPAHPTAAGPRRVMGALVVASIAFLGYTAISLAFAFSAGTDLASGSDGQVLGQFAMPLLLGFLTALVARGRWWAPAHALLYLSSVVALALYQGLVLGSTGWLYVLVAPVLPLMISLAMTRRERLSPAQSQRT